MAMNTDTAVLAAEAANFERISGELKAVMGQVDATAGGLQPVWQGQAGIAAQGALIRFQEAALKQQQALTDISTNIATSGTQYSTTDDDQASTLHGAMGI